LYVINFSTQLAKTTQSSLHFIAVVSFNFNSVTVQTTPLKQINIAVKLINSHLHNYD